MKIKGKYNTYEVKWAVYGCSYTSVLIYLPSKTFFGLIKYNKFLSEEAGVDSAERFDSGYIVRSFEAEKMFPEKMKEWFTCAVKSYEDSIKSRIIYNQAWEEFNKKNE